MNTDRYFRAVRTAFDFHQDQVRKGTDIPYVTHLMSVSSLVFELGGTEDQAIAAVLHDAIEDCTRYATTDVRLIIDANFGPDVLRMVEECSDTDQQPKPPWKERKEAYIQHLSQIGDDSLLVSLCDKLHNIRCTLLDYEQEGYAVFDKFKGGKEGTIWYYVELWKHYRKRYEDSPNARIKYAILELFQIVQKLT